MILTYVNINLELLIKLIAIKLRMRHILRILATPREIFCFPRQWLGGKRLVTHSVAWCQVSHTRTAQ